MKKVCLFNNLSKFSLKGNDEIEIKECVGSTISGIHSSVDPNSYIFCTITPMEDEDIIVPTEKVADMIRYCLKNRKYKVSVKPTSIWYYKDLEYNILFSNSIDMENSDIENILFSLVELITKEREDKKKSVTIKEMYIVYHIRNGREIIRTPNFTKAKQICDKNLGYAIKNRNGKVLYKSNYGRIAINITTNSDLANKLKSKNKDSNGVQIKI